MTLPEDDVPTSQRVVEAVADETGRDPMDLEPLYEVVDPDSLERIFRSDPSNPGQDASRVVFWYAGCRVAVSSDGSISVSPPGDGPATSFGSDGSTDATGSSGTPD